MKHKKNIILILVLTAICACFLYLISDKSNITVEVHNQSSTSIQYLKVVYTGGEFVLRNFPANESVRQRIHPTDDSHLTVTYERTRGNSVTKEIGTYFEAGLYRGTIHIYIEDDENIRGDDSSIYISDY